MNSIIHNRSNRLPRIKQLSFCQAGSEYQQLSRLYIHNAIKCSMCSKCPELCVFSALGQLLRWKKKVRRKIIFMTAQADRSSALSTASPSLFWTYKIFRQRKCSSDIDQHELFPVALPASHGVWLHATTFWAINLPSVPLTKKEVSPATGYVTDHSAFWK